MIRIIKSLLKNQTIKYFSQNKSIMKCDNCKKDQTWLIFIGSSFVCPRCVQKHKIMGLIFRTNTNVFKRILKKLKPKNYQEYLKLERKQIEPVIDFKKYGIRLKNC